MTEAVPGQTGRHGGDDLRGPHGRAGGEQSGAAARTPAKYWMVVAVVVIGFIVGGLGIIAHSNWVIAAGAALVVVGGVTGWATGIMENTE